MNDDNLRHLMKKDEYIPPKPSHEWANILEEIEKTSKPQFMSNLKFIGVFCSIALTLIVTFGGSQMYQAKIASENEILNTIEDSFEYFSEDEEYI